MSAVAKGDHRDGHAAQIAAALRAKRTVERRTDARGARPRRQGAGRAQRVRDRRRRRRAGAGARGRRGARQGRRAAARRRADRAQGRDHDRGPQDDLRLAHARELHRAVRRVRRRGPEERRHRTHRQDQHGRVRDGLVQRNLVLRHGEEPLEHRLRSRRQFRWLRRRGVGAAGAGRHRHRHRRLDPPARVAVRHLRHEADLWRLLALRPDRVRVEPRHARHVRAHGGGLRAHAERDGRPRSTRLHVARAAARGLHARPARSRCPGCASASPPNISAAASIADVAAADRCRARRIPQAGRDDCRHRAARTSISRCRSTT